MQNETHKQLHPPLSPYFEINEDALPYDAALHAALAASYGLHFLVPSIGQQCQSNDTSLYVKFIPRDCAHHGVKWIGSPSGAMEAHINKKKPEMVRRIFMSQEELYRRGN
ncbi:hypothetical protein NC652_002103 [Populus alba x Populus x berolinensis]|uniref:Uncharacterized protein n=1 Tax=Populus alba x Populus x berolinensis TaxID=444605 RepID=A0AAD6RND9_9ROSI|nr:hypothetical protein NC652_002103 [Populus alba x Populus x berolinensis]KAJ7011972.1 hypothetical protein NC653_002155 [Populus alba x Populus x berolinensis]